MAITAIGAIASDYPRILPVARIEGPLAEGSTRGATLAGAGEELAPVDGPEAQANAEELHRRAALDPRRPESIIRKASETERRSAQVLSEIAQLKSRDSEVRAHEAAHVGAGGRYITSAASYTYQKGPDGVQYAVGGEVGIDSSPEPGKPEETVQKMRIVRAAALAPSDPSAADLSVASAASEAEAEALAEIANEARRAAFMTSYATQIHEGELLKR